MLLKDLVDVSKRVRATTRRKEKTFLLGECLKRARGAEIALGASYLSGQIPQAALASAGQSCKKRWKIPFKARGGSAFWR
jgi:hypothetical protein